MGNKLRHTRGLSSTCPHCRREDTVARHGGVPHPQAERSRPETGKDLVWLPRPLPGGKAVLPGPTTHTLGQAGAGPCGLRAEPGAGTPARAPGGDLPSRAAC